MSTSDSLGDRMKRYEAVTRSILLPHSLTILRVDGRAFHSYLRSARRPFDTDFIADMQQVGAALCREVSGTVMAYGQSDEISLLISDKDPQSQPWFGGVVQKMASVAASVATAHLIAQRGNKGTPTFDARVFTVPTWLEAVNYFIWRQRDAVRNSISMAAQAMFSHNQLHERNTDQMMEMLFAVHGINWNNYPDEIKRGWTLTHAVREQELTFTDKRTDEVRTTTAERTFWDVSSPHFTLDYQFPSPRTA